MGPKVTCKWNIETVRYLLDRFYKDGKAWYSKIPEVEHDFRLPLEYHPEGCQDIYGIAVDLEGDKKADIFLYGDSTKMSVTAANLDSYLRPLEYRSPASFRTSNCETEDSIFTPQGFPYNGTLFPDTYGKISDLMFVTNRATEDAFLSLMNAMPDVNFHVLYPIEEQIIPVGLTNVEKSFQTAHGHYISDKLAQLMEGQNEQPLKVDFFPDYQLWDMSCDDVSPCGHGLWIQDGIYAGISEDGVLFAGDGDPYQLDTLGQSISLSTGSYLLNTGHKFDNGDMLSTSRYLFAKKSWQEISTKSNFFQLLASGKKIIFIDKDNINSADHIDMIFTPIEEVKDGRPVVFLAVPVYLNGKIPLLDGKESDCPRDFELIRQELEKEGFYVERLPYVFTGHSTKPRGAWAGYYNDAYSYNNVLMERYYDESGRLIKRVYMPWYGLPQYPQLVQYSKAAKSIYERYGYEVIPIQGLEGRALYGGSLRCLVKVTNRTGLN